MSTLKHYSIEASKKHILIACFLVNILAKIVKNRFMYVKVIGSQNVGANYTVHALYLFSPFLASGILLDAEAADR